MTIDQELVATFDENKQAIGEFDTEGQTLTSLAYVSVKVDYQINITNDASL